MCVWVLARHRFIPFDFHALCGKLAFRNLPQLVLLPPTLHQPAFSAVLVLIVVVLVLVVLVVLVCAGFCLESPV